MKKYSAFELEKFLITNHKEVPKEALELLIEQSRHGYPTGIAKTPEGKHYVLQTTGQGPYIIWEEK